MRETHAQSMGFWIHEPLVGAPEVIDSSIDELAAAGYAIVRVFLRKTNLSHRCPEVIEMVRRLVARAHSHQMKAVLDCEPHEVVARDMLRTHPSAAGYKLVRYTTRVVDGHWLLRIDLPAVGGAAAPRFGGVDAAFLEENGSVRKLDLSYRTSRGTRWYGREGFHRELYYREGVTPADPRRQWELVGNLPGVRDGELLIYARIESCAMLDFWAGAFAAYYTDLLEKYRDIPLDGVCWDEPAADCDWSAYRCGAGFAAAFERINGYRLADRLHLLDALGMTDDATKVRLDYYRTLNEGVAQAQAHLIRTARSLWGNDLILGSHHTWQGEGGIADYRAGAVDYFRLNDNMDAGYTDCSWWDRGAVAYAYTLASSLGRLTPSGIAEVNTWHYSPTVTNIRRNVNLMTLANVTWFNIYFGSEADCVLQQGHHTWPATVAATNRHSEYQQIIAARRPAIDVAIWHGWEGVCAWNQVGLANAHKAFCINTSQLLLERSIAADFIDSRLLEESRVVDGRLRNALGSYRVLVVPYAMAISVKAFQACAAFARAGGRVVFVGTPVARDTDGGSLADAFAELIGIPAMTAEHYMAGLDAVCSLPSSRPQRIEVCRPLPDGLPRTLVSCEGERHGVVSTDGNVVFLTDLDPQQRLIDRIEDCLPTNITVHGQDVLWRRYVGTPGDLLVVVAGEDRPLRGILQWDDLRIELTGGFVGLFDRSGRSVRARGDVVWKKI